MAKFADIHCHTGLHPLAFKIIGTGTDDSVWDYDKPLEEQRASKYPEFTQSDFKSLAKGKVKLIYVSIYPIEVGWFDAALINRGFITDWAAQKIAQVPKAFINRVQSPDHEYFDFLEKEYKLLKDENKEVHTIDGKDYKYVLLDHSDDIDAVLSEEGTIGVIMSVEGAQSFISGNDKTIKNGTEKELLDKTIENIEKVKSEDFPPFFVSMSHHFYNGFCGHTRSLPFPASLLLKQKTGMNAPINDYGRKIIDCFLGLKEYEGNGPRILIDTKHLSVSARLEYYDKIRAFNNGKEDTDKIPIVVSHTAYSGEKVLSEGLKKKDSTRKYKKSTTFNNWCINLFDDEIIEIFNSNGIIGLNFDERILAGHKVKKDYKKHFKKEHIENDNYLVKKFWAKQMLNNILGIVRVVVDSDKVADTEKHKIWNMLSIGTDFDGMINAEDGFITSEEFKDFRSVLESIMPDTAGIEKLLRGLTVEQVLDMIMFDNAYNFAKMYYFR